MGEIRTHKDLDVWKEAMNLVKEVYLVAENFPKEETYGLVSQIKRSAISIPSNIAEGAARSSRKEFIQFLYIALGSLAELETQLLLGQELGFIKVAQLDDRIERQRRLILGLLKYLKNHKQSNS